MRLSYLVFVTSAATILSIDEVAALVTSAQQSEVSTVASLDLVDAVQNSENTKRLLRLHKLNKVTDEERGFNAEKFNRMMSDQTYRKYKFNSWIKKKYTDRDIYELLQVELNPLYSRISNAYQSYIQLVAKNLISK